MHINYDYIKSHFLFLYFSSETSGAYVRYYYKGDLKVENLKTLEKPQNLRSEEISSNSVELVWDNSPAQFNDIGDKVQYKTDHNEWQTSAECTGGKATIRGLKPGTKYTFRVHAPDQIFLRENREIERQTKPGTFSSNLSVHVVTLESILLYMALFTGGLFITLKLGNHV